MPPAFAAASSDTEPCYKNGGAMGWILCPAITATSGLLDHIYDTIEEDYLQVQAKEIFNSSNGVIDVWGGFRNIANVIFVAFLLIIILSQITGVGIDNYGIKRILPRLVVTAVLVNASYMLCEIAVDAANIIGSSLRSFLENGFDIAAAPGASGVGLGAAALLETAGVVAFFFINPGAIVTLLLFLLSMVVAVIFLWVILIARQAGIVIGIAIAPLAFVCYMFPNSEKYFKKWFDLLKGLLLLYPICSLVVGGGKLAGAILSNIGDGSWKVAAMIVQVVPYFMIPSLLRSSLNAVNGLGNKIGRTGSVLQRSANNRMQHSELANRGRTGVNAAGARMRSNAGQRVSNSKIGRGISNSALGRAGRAIGNTGVGRAIGGAVINRRARAMEAQEKQRQIDTNARAVYLDQVSPNETPDAVRTTALNALDSNDEAAFTTAMARLDSQSQKKVMDEYANRVMRGRNGETVDGSGNLIGYANSTASDKAANLKRTQIIRRAAQGNKDFQRLLATKSTDVNNYVNDAGGYQMDSRGRIVDNASNTGRNITDSRYNDYAAKLEDFQGMSTEATRRFFASAAENGQNVGAIAESVINSDSQIARSIMNDPDKANIFRAAAQASRSGTDVRSAIGASVADASFTSGRRIVSGTGAKSTAASFADQYTANTTARNDWAKGGVSKLMDGVAAGNVTANDMRAMLNDADLQQTFTGTTEGRQVQQAMQAAVQYTDEKKGNEQSFATEYVSAQAAGNMKPIEDLSANYEKARAKEAADARLAEEQQTLYVQHEQDAQARGRDTLADASGHSYVNAAGNNIQGYAAPADFRVRRAVEDFKSHDAILYSNDGRRWNATTGRYLKANESVDSRSAQLRRGKKI